MDMIPPEAWSKVISAAVVPAVLISASGLLCLAFYNRLTAIVGRLRIFQQEALREKEELRSRPKAGDTDILSRRVSQQTVDVLQHQMAQLLRRCRLIRRTLFGLLAAITCLLLCSMTAGGSVFWPGALYISGPLFMAGLLSMLGAIAFAMMELRVALDPVELESEFVVRVGGGPGTTDPL